MSAVLTQDSLDSFIYRTIGPIVYVKEPSDVKSVFSREPKTGTVIIETSLPPNVLRELPHINRLARHHSSRFAFNQACKNTHLGNWIEDQIDELGPEYPRAILYRTLDFMTPWHVDLMKGRRRAFIQIDGTGLKIASPPSIMELAFNQTKNNQPFFPKNIDPEEYLREKNIQIIRMRQGQIAVFGDYGLHASGDGSELRAIAY